jgi:tripartite-type tricarboxylate transporter receptor subunit TctC
MMRRGCKAPDFVFSKEAMMTRTDPANPMELRARPAAERSRLTTATALAALLLGAVTLPAPAWAQGAFPNRPIKLVVDSPPGGSTDLLGRIAAEGLSQKLGVSVVVENKAGATGGMASEYVLKSPADGYTLLFCSNGNLMTRPFLERGFTLNPVTDIAPVFNAAELPHVLVVPGSLPVKDLRGFIAYGKANPGKIFYGSAGTGSQPHMAVSHLGRLAGIQVEHVPYKGLGAAMTDLLAGRLQVLSAGLGTVRPYLKGGELRPLAVASKTRLSGLPDVPTSAEAGLPGWEMSAWFGVFAPKGTSPEIVRSLNEKLQAVFDDPAVKQKLAELGAEPVGGSVQSFSERVRSDYRLYGQMIKDSGIKLD